ncbi:MAG: ATP-binding protein, partial [Bdellovibrionales bacterium]|nr:ATP-binding protein [Bdellovibrionales bacterium]
LFDGLVLSGTGNPTNNGTFRFDKGLVSNFHFKNLSGGEKAAFDLLLDFIIKKQAFDDTVFCIDEPELHMHTKLQGKLLEQLFELLPNNCQLWISTHSIGMARKAAELYRLNPKEVVFIDFHNEDFDQSVILSPKKPNRLFWKNMFDTALDDLADLVVPSKVVFCEGKKLGSKGRNPSFDSSVYTKIFSEEFPDVDFVPLGGDKEVRNDSKLWELVLKRLAPGVKASSVFDRDDRSNEEIDSLKNQGVRVLDRRDLENYLWDDEILTKLAVERSADQKASIIISKKNELLSRNETKDDVKSISGELYNFCKTTLSLAQCGNNAQAFARDTLASLVSSDTDVYKELKLIIFGRMEMSK